MRALWKGNVSFGLLNVPIELYPVVHEQDIRFHLLSAEGHCRLRRKLYCPDTDKEYDFSETTRGYEIAPDQYVIVEPDELEQLEPESNQAFDIEDFVALAEIDPIYFRASYYAAPDERADRAFVLLRDVLSESGLAAVGKFVMREKEYLATLRPFQDVMIVNTMYFNEDVRTTEDLPHPKKISLKKEETALALKLVDAGATTFKPAQYKNEYRTKVKQLIKQKSAGKKISVAPKKGHTKVATNVVDLTAALKRSIARRGKSGKKHSSTGKERRRSAAG